MDMDISMDIHGKSVDMDMDMDGKYHIHGKPAETLQAKIDWQSPFQKGDGHFGPKFQVEGDIPHQPFVHG